MNRRHVSFKSQTSCLRHLLLRRECFLNPLIMQEFIRLVQRADLVHRRHAEVDGLRLLDRHVRFRELQRESIYETILRLRLDEVKRRLRTTHDANDSIALACGWNNPNALKNLFRRRFGVSMRTFRTSGV